MLGGAAAAVAVGVDELAWARRVYDGLVAHDGPLAFGRVDATADAHGELRVLECELVIPRLLLREGEATARYAAAIDHHLRR
ncbi:hypothetical protein SAMN02745121_01399 [Nannocystis exedens]|uniref:Uncharacterized protein n=1 Tax=Nannocystis exedens TaxID=54 RepID=A0A1I1V5V2_9BACT|nr:hypothetical protein [Nannocystis exedens]PCC72190.1 hypothetical protein NAEX_05269 [Nannocystis exedens]SFD75700.1 hypothetical protein SAMN02745121_01399 [Nannocystis exedens]